MVVGDRNENSSLKVELSKVCRKRHADRWWWSWRLRSKVPEVDPAVPVLSFQPILSINSCPPAILELTTAILTRPNWTWFQTGWNSPVEFPRGWRIVHCCEKIVWTFVYRTERLPNCRLAFLGVIGVIFYRSVVISRTLKKGGILSYDGKYGRWIWPGCLLWMNVLVSLMKIPSRWIGKDFSDDDYCWSLHPMFYKKGL